MRLTHWIDGEARDPADGGWLGVFDPATGQPFAEVARGSAADGCSSVRAYASPSVSNIAALMASGADLPAQTTNCSAG